MRTLALLLCLAAWLPVASNANLEVFACEPEWQALQAAGGENEFGAINRLELFSSTGKRRVLDLKDDKNKHVRVRENDSINVPQKNWLGK